MAENTLEGTSFEEDHRADAGAVLQAAALDLDYERKVVHGIARRKKQRV
jgi:hypothetical protein